MQHRAGSLPPHCTAPPPAATATLTTAQEVRTRGLVSLLACPRTCPRMGFTICNSRGSISSSSGGRAAVAVVASKVAGHERKGGWQRSGGEARRRAAQDEAPATPCPSAALPTILPIPDPSTRDAPHRTAPTALFTHPVVCVLHCRPQRRQRHRGRQRPQPVGGGRAQAGGGGGGVQGRQHAGDPGRHRGAVDGGHGRVPALAPHFYCPCLKAFLCGAHQRHGLQWGGGDGGGGDGGSWEGHGGGGAGGRSWQRELFCQEFRTVGTPSPAAPPVSSPPTLTLPTHPTHALGRRA